VTPSTARQLIDNGFKIIVESSRERIFDDMEYVDVPGVTMVPTGSWANAESGHLILGLKELAAKDCMSSSLSCKK
jgi:saccharopine dehydrogenase (NAD+, L-lysine-forming)